MTTERETEKKTRRDVMKAISLGATGLALSRAVGAPARTPQERPNVLWLYCEDLSPWLPAYGDTTVKTPLRPLHLIVRRRGTSPTLGGHRLTR